MTDFSKLPDVNIWMTHPDLTQIQQVDFPAGYHMRFYQGAEDIDKWVKIQQISDPFITPTAEHFNNSMPGTTEFRSKRIMFLVNPVGQDIGSITAWQTTKLSKNEIGQIHWVAILPSAQGQRLAIPMTIAACQRIVDLGHTKACLSTNTRRIPALNLYAKLGFRPMFQAIDQKEAWAKIALLIKY